MKVKLHSCQPVSSEDVSLLETTLNSKLPYDYKEFLKLYNSGIAEDNVFDKTLLLGITSFVPIENIYNLMQKTEGLPCHAILFAEGHGGKYLYIHKVSNKVFFWDHEVEDDKEIAANFTAFLELLVPFDFSLVHSEPPKVLSGWVKPNFKPKFD